MHQGCPAITHRVGLGHHRSGTEASVNNAAPVAKTMVSETPAGVDRNAILTGVLGTVVGDKLG